MLQNQLNGNQVGLPILQTAQVMYTNTTWAAELGLVSPRYAQRISETRPVQQLEANLSDETKGNDGIGGWILDHDPLTLLSWFQVFGF